MTVSSPTVGVVGAGYWGKNLVRNFYDLGALACVCETRAEVRCEMERQYGVRLTADFDALLADTSVRGVVIAAPAAQHFALSLKALKAGKDVFVEKPLALFAEEGRTLVRVAEEHGAILMVGHILQYHPAVLALKRMIAAGELGRIQYIHSSRLNLGKLRMEENILWSFAPHDISAILYLLDEIPTRVTSQGSSFLNSASVDTTLTTCDFKSGVKAHIFVSWLHPFKEQKLTIVGGRKMAVFDDMDPERKLVLYSHKIDWVDRVPIAHKDVGQAVPLPVVEPLHAECEHFLACMRERSTPRTDGSSAVSVLEILEACERSVKEEGQPIALRSARPPYFAHESAVIDPGCEIGESSHIWHFSHVMAGARVGAHCNFGQNVLISPGVTIGNNVKIQNNVSVYTGVELEDDVFCGPSMVFTNVNTPRSHVNRKNEYRKTLVRRGASIGANATILSGITIGRYAFIGAGAVVTHDVPDYALAVGTPARRVGWVCHCGVRLSQNGTDLSCPACKRAYTIDQGVCVEQEARVIQASALTSHNVAA